MKKLRVLTIVMALAIVVTGCGGGGGSADAGKDVAGTYFSCKMPSDPTVEDISADELASFNMTMKGYALDIDDGKEAYAIVEMDWKSLVEMMKAADASVDKATLTQSLTSQFGAGADAGVENVGDMKAIKIDSSVMKEFAGTTELSADAQIDAYMIPSDQALLLVMYGGDNYNADTAKNFFGSFKAKGLTYDTVSLD